MLSSIATSTSSRRRTAPWRARPIESTCATAVSGARVISRALSKSPLASTGWSCAHALRFFIPRCVSETYRSTAIAAPTAATTAIGNIIKPPPAKTPTIESKNSTTEAAPPWPRHGLSLRVRAGTVVPGRLRPDLVVVELALEHLAVDGLAPVIEGARYVERAAHRRALPGHDHERLRRVVVADDRHARELLVAGGLRRLIGRARHGGREQQSGAAEQGAVHRVLPSRPRAEVRDPHRGLLVARHGLEIELVLLERARGVAEVHVAEDREVAPREVEPRVEREHLLVAPARLREAARLAIDDPELVQRHGMPRVERERLLQARFGVLEIALLAIGDREVDVGCGRIRSGRRHLDELRDGGVVLLLLQRAHRAVEVGARGAACANRLGDREAARVMEQRGLRAARRAARSRAGHPECRRCDHRGQTASVR